MNYGMKMKHEIAKRMKHTKPFFSEQESDMGGNRGNKRDPGNAKPVKQEKFNPYKDKAINFRTGKVTH